MKLRLISVLCAVMLLLTFAGCEFPWNPEPTEEPTEPLVMIDPNTASAPLEFVDGKEVVSGKAQLSQMEIPEVLAALAPYGFSLDDCSDEKRAEWENEKLMYWIKGYEFNMMLFVGVSGRPDGRLQWDLESAIKEYYEWDISLYR